MREKKEPLGAAKYLVHLGRTNRLHVSLEAGLILRGGAVVGGGKC